MADCFRTCIGDKSATLILGELIFDKVFWSMVA